MDVQAHFTDIPAAIAADLNGAPSKRRWPG
jgi:hypothetical protein